MEETPMLYNTEMVRAILDGRKTKTRRLNGLKEINENPDDWIVAAITRDHITFTSNTGKLISIKWKYKPGDLLWVRETWSHESPTDFKEDDGHYVYKAEMPDEYVTNSPGWKPSLFMPKSACRLWLRIKDIRVERLNDITNNDALAEGTPDLRTIENNYDMKDCFRILWDSINKKTYPWESNPWVWVVEFERCEKGAGQ
jgi:hypothetical protein